jgi:hypothetical protein
MDSSKWLTKLKIAIINEDYDAFSKLTKSMPETFTCKQELLEASALTKEAIAQINIKKDELGKEMAKLKQVRKYTNS